MSKVTTPKPAKSRYAGDRRKLNIAMSDSLIMAAQAYFKTTKHGSFNAFLEAKTAEEFRKKAPQIRAAGIKVPESVFIAK